jgi:hypothetical protein
MRADNKLAIVDNDNDPSAAGYHVPGTMPQQCYWGHNPDVGLNNLDHDGDWVDDQCEYRLAVAFRPVMRLHSGDPCMTWQPYWAAKSFSNSSLARIAYMPAYYQDCGTPYLGHATHHNGDSELVTVQIRYDYASNHWMVESVWTSAHYQSDPYGTGQDASHWNSWYDVQYLDKSRGRPIIWVSKRKHANYASHSGCIGAEANDEWKCSESYLDRHFPVHQERNAGSRWVDLLGCTYAQNAPNVGSGRCEKFFNTSGHQRFQGWYPQPAPDGEGTGDATAYEDILVSDKFHVYIDPAGNADEGPGPGTPPPWQDPPWFTAEITGPSQVQGGLTCQWGVVTTNGTAVSYQWTVDGNPVSTAPNLQYASYNNFQIGVTVWNSAGDRADHFFDVQIVEGMYCT